MLLAEQLVGGARARRARRMSRHERIVNAVSASVFMAVACGIAASLPDERSAHPALLLGLIAAYAIVSRVRFEFGSTFVTPEQLVFVPMLMLAPLPYIPLLVVAAALLAQVPDFVSRTWHRDRIASPFADSWFSVGPVLVIASLAPGEPELGLAGAYALAFLAQIAGDFAWATLRDRIVDRLPALDRVPFMEIWKNYYGVARFDAALSAPAFVVATMADEEPAALAALLPITLLLATFGHERRERYGKTLELQRAYRGIVMLLTDVVEFDDPYTASHSRSVVDLAHAVAERLKLDATARQELEFAAMLHDVGKITIPKEILAKPSALTRDEFEIVKTHTIEGQYMLDSVGGLFGRVGEIVRSCHERWDGSGYPDGLKGEEIPLPSRIVFCCDAFNAMTTDRLYRPAMSTEAALAELAAHAGSQFDPRVVSALTHVVGESDPALAIAGVMDEVRAVLAERPPAAPAI